MKKTCLAGLFILAFILSTTTIAQSQIDRFQEGFIGPEEGFFLVKSVLDAGLFSDESPVILTGFILTSLGNELYTFEDLTGTILMEIKDEIWFGLRVDPTTKVIIRGVINYEFQEKLIEASSVRLAQ